MELLKRKKKTKNRRYLLFIIVGIFFMLLGISVIIGHCYNNNKKEELNKEMIDDFLEIDQQEETTPKESENEQTIIQPKAVNYIAVLEIPKINLKRGLVDKTSPNNNVNKNIYILKDTTLPDEQVNSHIILAAHSGNSYIAFFKNLKKLNMEDIVYFYYKGIKYVYKLCDKYEIKKTGSATLKQTNGSDITLITCISGTNKQVVYLGVLIDKVEY